MPDADAVLSTDLPFPKTGGKVRDVYDVGEDRLLIVATDRISAFDVVMPTGVPGKGVLLTTLAAFWFERLGDRFPHHLIEADVERMDASIRNRADVLRGRSMLVRKLAIVPFECVVRGYLAGSGWREYLRTGAVCGVALPPGLKNGSRLPEPIFTPATKATSGHDENVSLDVMANALGEDVAKELKQRSLDLYADAAAYAERRGVILADTKFEFGRDTVGQLILADEVLTPDSSRYWPAEDWRPGEEQPSFDKQFVREYLAKLAWDRTPPAPALPAIVVEGTLARYREALRRLTGAVQ